ncbi:unnamed protein product [Protopolystoma xenopodis]|uniref:Uncharacterized protein n=1 Tax=Protopolystoma xenopodis TaxID=117903 RepID=A0A448WJF5_9PLAT|nr:unnamed protein product [Protopolystoma xenopodis]
MPQSTGAPSFRGLRQDASRALRQHDNRVEQRHSDGCQGYAKTSSTRHAAARCAEFTSATRAASLEALATHVASAASSPQTSWMNRLGNRPTDRRTSRASAGKRYREPPDARLRQAAPRQGAPVSVRLGRPGGGRGLVGPEAVADWSSRRRKEAQSVRPTCLRPRRSRVPAPTGGAADRDSLVEAWRGVAWRIN